MALHPWPELREEDHWAIKAMEEVFATSERDPADMLAEAKELRERAARVGPHGGANACLAMADRWEAAAAARLSAR